MPLSLALLREMEIRLQEVEEAAARRDAALLLIRAAPSHPLLTGYDLDEIRALNSPGIFDWSQQAQAILRRLEQLAIPTVAVVRSDWAGGAAELALACSHRIAAASPDARLALPQTRRGLVPAWGGTVRLPRLIGLQRALRLILSGEPVSAKDALEIGLVDQLIPIAEFEERLQKYALGLAEASGAPGRSRAKRKRRVARRLVEDTAPGRRLLAARASRRYLTDASTATLAARLALELILESSALPLAEAFERESRIAGELIITNETRGRLHSERVTEQAARTSPAPGGEPHSAAVIGAGETGSDLAYLLLRGGGLVRIKDAREAARTGVARARGRIAWDVRQGRLKEEEGRRRSTRVQGVSGFGGFGVLDIAVFAPDGTSFQADELVAEVEPHVREECLLAVHDWAMASGELEGRVARSDRLIGISPAFPVNRFPLLEILPTATTSAGTIADVRSLAHRCGLTPVVVRNGTPSPGVRLLSVFLAEATRLLGRGTSVETIDAALEEFGFSLGPFRRMDSIGTARVRRMLSRVAEVLGERATPASPLLAIAASGGTFYRYRGGRPAGPNAQLAVPASEASDDDNALQIRRRILLLLINEAAHILEDAGVETAADLDLISILALGFPREHGGLLYHAETSGLAGVADDLRNEAERHGARFAPAPLIGRLAEQGRGFFSEPRPRSGHDSDAVLQ